MAIENFEFNNTSVSQPASGDGVFRILLSSLSGAIAAMFVVLCFANI